MEELFDPLSQKWIHNKFETYKILRNLDRAYYSKKFGMHVITRYDDVLFALSNPEIFSSATGNLIVEREIRYQGSLGSSDDPIHEGYKNIVKEAYSKQNIERISSVVSARLRDMLVGKDTVNISNVINEISALQVAELINMPYDKEYVKDLILHIQYNSELAREDGNNERGMAKFKLLANNLANIFKTPATGPGIHKEYLANAPGTNLPAVRSLYAGVTLSGASSMMGALQFLTVDLYRNNLLEKVFNDRSLIPNAINESLRYHASTGRFRRRVVKEVTIHGVTLKPGDLVGLCLESANRDPSKFPDPDNFDLSRNTAGHLAFGYGAHACIALVISKACMSMYLETLFDTFGLYKITTAESDFEYIMTGSGNDDMISNLQISRLNFQPI
jgi:cytochrome P450